MMDNIWKRQHVVARLLGADLIGHRILEIGCGACTSISAVSVALLGVFKYIGTDVSEKFCKYGRKLGRNVVHTDILVLPSIDGGFTRVMALDTLEHINPADRKAGYMELNRVMSEHCKILINMPIEETLHDLHFDHPFGLNDILEIGTLTNTTLTKYDPYVAVLPKQTRRYVWVELER